MRITIEPLGAGSALSIAYDNSNFLITFEDAGVTKRYLFDCGITAPKIWKRKLAAVPLDGILITHTHGDHCGGVEEIAFHHKYAFGRKLELFTRSDVWERLWNQTLLGGLGGGSSNPSDFFNLHLDAFPAELESARWIRMQHISPTFPNYGAAFRIGGKLLWFSGDCSFHQEMFTAAYWREMFAQDSPDLILHEVQFGDGGVAHTSYDDLRALPSALKAKTVLYHYHEMSVMIAKDGFLGFATASEFNGTPLVEVVNRVLTTNIGQQTPAMA